MEVLATLVLIGLVLPAVMQGVSLALFVEDDARRRTEAAALAELKLNELVADESLASAASGDFGTDWPAYRWRSSQTSGPDSMTELSVEVWWTDRGEEKSFTLTTWVRPDEGGLPQ